MVAEVVLSMVLTATVAPAAVPPAAAAFAICVVVTVLVAYRSSASADVDRAVVHRDPRYAPSHC